MGYLIPFILVLFLVAVLFRIDFFFYLLYLFFGIYFFSRLWAERAIRQVSFERDFLDRAFPGERVHVALRIRNHGLLPLPWLRVHESIPIQLKAPNFHRRVLSLLPHEDELLSYDLECRNRGYYTLGPLLVSTGNLFGASSVERRMESVDHLTVYPRIVPLTHVPVPAQMPFGSVATRQRIYEDPARVVGVRDYQGSDSIRHVHWTASAAAGTLKVKRFEPAISIESQIFLNLSRSEYTQARAIIASEMAIVTAASLANHLIEKRQSVGLSSNGIDPLGVVQDGSPIILPPAKGRAHLMHILGILARVQLAEEQSFGELVSRARLHMTWGSTGIIISAGADDALFGNMLLMKRSGFHVMLVVVDPKTSFLAIQQRAKDSGIVAYQIWRDEDLDVWR